MIGGFIVQGPETKRVIIRAIGPELTRYGVPNPLFNPTLELHDATGALIASNDNWQTTIIRGIITSDQRGDIRAIGHAPRDGRESAIIAELRSGNYTAIVRGVNDTTGVTLVEAYDLSPEANSTLGDPLWLCPCGKRGARECTQEMRGLALRHSERSRGCNAADDIRRGQAFNLDALHSVGPRDPSTSLRSARDDNC
jgi:hypothetical protein